jgi:histidine kinase-like protein
VQPPATGKDGSAADEPMPPAVWGPVGLNLGTWARRSFRRGVSGRCPARPRTPKRWATVTICAPVRRFVASRAKGAGLTPPRIPDLLIAASELAANTLRHTGGGTVQVWRTGEEIICQVADTGQITDPLARHRGPLR